MSGTVLTEHIGDPTLSVTGEEYADRYVHDRDLGVVEEFLMKP